MQLEMLYLVEFYYYSKSCDVLIQILFIIELDVHNFFSRELNNLTYSNLKFIFYFKYLMQVNRLKKLLVI